MEVKVVSMKVVKNFESVRKAYAAVVIDNCIRLNDVVVVEGREGLFVSMPQRRYEDNGEVKYANVYNPITKEARQELITAVLEAYQKEVEKA